MHRLLTAGVIAGLARRCGALAQESDEETLEPIEVTGSKIKRRDLDSAIPVTILSAAVMQLQGITDLKTALAHLSQNSGGMIDQRNNNDFIKDSSAVNLRGVGANRSLVQIDGKRMPVFPITADANTNIVDVQSRQKTPLSKKFACRRPYALLAPDYKHMDHHHENCQ